MTARTFNELFEPPITLSIVPARGGYIVWDQACRFYILAPSSLEFCLKFMAAMAEKGDAILDDASIEMATWTFAQEHSVRVPSNVVPIRRGA